MNWLRWELWGGGDSRPKATMLVDRVAEPWGPSLLVDADMPGFLRNTYPTYLRLRDKYALDKGTIAAYVSGKHETYFENRGAKLALALERLRAVCSRRGGDRILPTPEFKKLGKLVGSAIDAIAPCEAQNEALRSKVGGLNRRSFRHLVSRALRELDAECLAKDLPEFVKSRDSLVHEGDFWCKSTDCRKRRKCPFNDRLKEYRFMLHFMDRLLLKLVGYSGRYFDVDRRTCADLP